MAWYDPNFAYKKSIVIPHGHVSGGSDLLDFPVLISFTDANLKSMANGGLVASSSGYDLLFTDGTETRELPYEVESYTASSGALVCWVRVPVLSAAQDTVLYLYFGNSTVSGFQATASNVWDGNYKAVYHLSDNAASTTVADSTVGAHNGTNQANTSTKTASGEIASGLSFNGTSDYVLANSVASAIASGDLTYAFWFNPTTTLSTSSGNAFEFFVCLADSPSTNDAKVFFNKSDGLIYFQVGGISGQATSTQSSWTAGTWYHIASTYSGTTGLAIYVNGVLGNTVRTTTRGNTTSAEFDLARQYNGNYFNGILDEVRISNVARTANWIATEYTNQSSPSTFHWIGELIPYTGNVDDAVMVKSGVTTTQTSADQINVGAKGINLTMSITTCGSGETFTLTVQGKDATSGAYYNIASFSGLGLGTTTCMLYPGLSPSATVASAVLPKAWRVYVTPGTSDSSTYSVGASLIA